MIFMMGSTIANLTVVMTDLLYPQLLLVYVFGSCGGVLCVPILSDAMTLSGVGEKAPLSHNGYCMAVCCSE